MILNEFFNLPQVFEKDMAEGVMSEIDAELRNIVANEDFDALYELFTANTPAGKFVQDMYDDVVIDTGLHPDDDFERIEQIVFDRLADDFSEQGVAEGHADQQRKIFKKNGHPVGEVGIDRESSPGNGQWYMKYYATGDDFSGYDSMEEAVADLKHLVNQFKAEGVAEGWAGALTGGALGLFGGPVGALFGAWLGHALQEKAKSNKAKTQNLMDQGDVYQVYFDSKDMSSQLFSYIDAFDKMTDMAKKPHDIEKYFDIVDSRTGNSVFKYRAKADASNFLTKMAVDRRDELRQAHLNQTQGGTKESVNQGVAEGTDELAKQYGWAYNQGEYGASMTHPKHGRISLSSPITSRSGDTAVEREWTHNNASGVGDRSLAQHLQSLKEQDVAEGIFGSKPNPVLPIVDKIAKVAGGLTPQNVEVGKQIIQANARDIARMLSPQSRAGIDVIEGTRERLSNLHDKIRKEKDLPDPKEYLKIAQQKKKEIADLKAQDKKEVGEGKGDYVPPKEADYGDDYQAMVKRVGEKARAQEKAKQQQPKPPVRESRRALLKQIIQS